MANLYDVTRLADVFLALFRSGRRTLHVHDVAAAERREYDAQYQSTLVELLSDIADTLEERGYPCVLVNASLFSRGYAERPVTDPVLAASYNKFNSGGKRAVGLRRALPDDLVRPSEHRSMIKLGGGLQRHAVRHSIGDVQSGLATPDTHAALVQDVTRDYERLSAIQPDEQQTALPLETERPALSPLATRILQMGEDAYLAEHRREDAER